MWFIQPKRNYIPEMPWERTDEPEVMSWQIRVRDYNTFVANVLFFSLVLFQAIFLFFAIFGKRVRI